ncbi:glycoside hydrolase family 99-like domain-containing protein [Aestuariivivens sediminis]|uniref:glycosyltransferase WbsX family protein n=1 Tax=Aestuariivivens sediminis TaxID=2913557 RepID=UPI001F597D8F|nr:glycoside hydrolase family 99-like domain-containing protein [Aestuariivivens sediminis]
MSKLRPIAFVLPQYHPIPENDVWWGKGFTEWTNVTRAKPLFKGHYQPQLPTDLGFYDLRLPEARKAQADLAKEYGIHGFCYYHYWFNGKRLLDEPIDGMLAQKDLDMPFMLCWANENWTRRWDGKENEVLMKQEYRLDDDMEHIRWLCENVFSDERCIKVNGCPVFSVYDHRQFPDLKQTGELWRQIAKEEYGFPNLYLIVIESFNRSVDPNAYDFDATIEFSPHMVLKQRVPKSFLEKKGFKKTFDFRDFKSAVSTIMSRPKPDFKLFRCVTPSWDNTARKGKEGTICIGSSPELYYKWLHHIVTHFKPYSKEENFVFINAMNEWAEGNHLEPCIKYGRAYLEATKKALEQND